MSLSLLVGLICYMNLLMLNYTLDLPSLSEHRPIAKLAHGLDRVLFKYASYLLIFEDRKIYPNVLRFQPRSPLAPGPTFSSVQLFYLA
jgi:hypothetical protein